MENNRPDWGIRIGRWLLLQIPGVIIAIILVVVINIAMNENQSAIRNQLEKTATSISHFGKEISSFMLTYLSSKVQSPQAQVKMAEKLIIDGDLDSAWGLYGTAIQKAPSLGLKAGKYILENAETDEDIRVATTYLTSAAQRADSAEAFRLLGYIALGKNHQISCKTWKRSLNWFELAAKHGDGIGQLITAFAYGGGLGVNKNDRKLLGYLLVAKDADDQKASALAGTVLDTFALFFLPNEAEPVDSFMSPYPSETENLIWMAETLEIGLPNFDILKSGNSQALPEYCYTIESSDAWRMDSGNQAKMESLSHMNEVNS